MRSQQLLYLGWKGSHVSEMPLGDRKVPLHSVAGRGSCVNIEKQVGKREFVWAVLEEDWEDDSNDRQDDRHNGEDGENWEHDEIECPQVGNHTISEEDESNLEKDAKSHKNVWNVPRREASLIETTKCESMLNVGLGNHCPLLRDVEPLFHEYAKKGGKKT